MRRSPYFRTGLAALMTLLLISCSAPEKINTVEAGSAVTGEYQNLFAEAGYSQTEIEAKIEAAFQQLFYGDPDNEAVYYPTGENDNGPLAYILDVHNNDVRSEGMSYGMMIAVQMDRKQAFDAIWNWSKTYMYHANPEHPAKGYFAWSVRTTGEPIDELPAPDGEEYFATALYFAAVRWGNGEGIYNYSAQADQLLTDILHRESITGKTRRGPVTAINLFDKEAKMVRFTPHLNNAARTDASYHLPGFYEVWARVGPQRDREFWQEAAQVSRDYFVKATHPDTALTPDYGNFDGTPWAAPWRPEAADFRYDAWRTAMNWSMDWAWWRADPRQVELSNRLQAFFASEGLDDYVSLYTLDGKKLDDEQTTGLVAMNAAAGLAASHPRKYQFIQALWDSDIPEGQYRYYDGMLYMMSLLHCSGQYKAWLPQ
jgi:oligosaccharide reducing-end xylanase